MFYSPLRYPGGKKRLAEFIGQVCQGNGIDGHFVEPFSGGASVALSMLIEGKVERITLNDYDRSIYAFWYSALNDPEALCERISCAELTMEIGIFRKRYKGTRHQRIYCPWGFRPFL